jgi:hypothetical protein
MGKIEPTRTNVNFRNSDLLFGRIVEELESFEAAGMIDKGIFYSYVKEILFTIGAGVYMEDHGVIEVKNFNAPLPGNFSIFWSAWKVKESKEFREFKGYDPRIDYTLYTMPDIQNALNKVWKFDIECPSQMDLTSKVAVRYYVDGNSVDHHNFNFSEPTLLSLGTVHSKEFIDQKSPCFRSGSPSTISIEQKFVHTNFEKGFIYLVYYGLPIDDDTGLPLIPDNPLIEKTIEFYIEYRLLRKWYLNNKVPDLERKVAMVKSDYDFAFGEALTETKTPSFQAMERCIKQNRRRLSKMQLNDCNFRYSAR